MADLVTNFDGIRCPNPFWLASGPPTNTGAQVMRAFDAGWGGAVWKTIGEPIVKVSSHRRPHAPRAHSPRRRSRMRRLRSLLARLPGRKLHHHGQNRNRPPRRILGPKDRRMNALLPQRRRDAKMSAEKTSGIRLCLVHPSEARTALVGQASACQSERSSDSSILNLVFSALISAPLRLCGGSNPAQRETQ